MFCRALMACACLTSVAGLASAADATTFGYGFVIDFQNGEAAIGQGHLFTTDNGDNTFTITGADGAAANFWFAGNLVYANATILGAGSSLFSPDWTAAPIITSDGQGNFSLDNLTLFGMGDNGPRFYDFHHDEDGDLVGFSIEVGGPAQFQFGIDDEQPSPTPEAATWGMMLVGFGAMGASMRRRRTSVSFA